MGVLGELFYDLPVVTREADPRVLGPVVDPWPQEREAVARAVAKRQHEYFATRHLARAAFVELGVVPTALLNNADRSPIWPEGTIGSLSHTDGWCGVAVARPNVNLNSLGIDAERVNPMSDGVMERVLTPDELQEVTQSGDPLTRATLHFSAKESLYKAIFGRVRRFVGFLEVEIVPREESLFEVRLVAAPLAEELGTSRIEGRYRVEANLCVTAVVIR